MLKFHHSYVTGYTFNKPFHIARKDITGVYASGSTCYIDCGKLKTCVCLVNEKGLKTKLLLWKYGGYLFKRDEDVSI